MLPASQKIGRRGARWGAAVGLGLALGACNNPGAAPTVDGAFGTRSGTAIASTGGSDGTTTASPQFVTQFAAFSPQSSAPAGGAGGTGGSGSASQAIVAPFGVSTGCGDAIVGTDEECDDGDEGADACTAHCQTRDEPAAPGEKTDRYLGFGRHPIAGLDKGFIDTYVEFPDDQVAIGATLFNVWGQPGPHVNVSDGASPIDEANPVAAALPGGAYAVAWGDFDSDDSDLGVALRKVNTNGSLGPLGVANAGHEFSQLNPDILYTGTQVVVAWEDYADAVNGPDLRYRLFDADLNPLSDDTVLAASALPEAAVALAPFGTSWAAAYREGMVDGKENVVVKVGDSTFRTGPVYGGPLDDRPALVALDATHLLLVFSAGTDPGLTGVYNVPRLRYALIDTAGSTTPASFSFNPLDDIFQTDNNVSHLSPSAVTGAPATTGPQGVYVAWRSEARPGDAAGDQIWLKYVSWDPTRTTPLELREPETLIPRTCEGSFGDQRTPELANVPASTLPPSGALAIAWDDYSHSQAANAGVTPGDPDVVVEYAPTQERSVAQGSVFRETWSRPDGPLPSYWSSSLIAPATLGIVSQRAVVSGTGAGSFWVNDITALNVDMTTKVVFNFNGARAELIARYGDPPLKSYFSVYFGTMVNDTWRLYWVDANGNATVVATAVQPPIFTNYGQGVEYRLRFRVVTNPDNTVFLGGKLWGWDVDEPVDWTVKTLLAANSPAALAMAHQAGHFGLVGLEAQAGRQTTFDDLEVHYYNGAYAGTFDPPVQTPEPLVRAPADDRTCRPGHECGKLQGCCTQKADCSAGMSCVHGFGDLARLGTNVDVCMSTHCSNKILDADETFADCGGADCAACTCTSTKLPGAGGYCTPSCPCGAGGTDCSTSADCLPGLLCYNEMGYRFGYALGTDTCLPPHCLDRYQDGDEVGIDWGGSCGPNQCPPESAHWCTVSCPCPKGKGDCDYPDECQAGLVCSTKGANFGVAYNVCIAQHCTNKVRDGDETAVDCGSPDCGNCP